MIPLTGEGYPTFEKFESSRLPEQGLMGKDDCMIIGDNLDIV